MSAAYTKVGVQNYLGVPVPDIEVFFETRPELVPVTNTEGIATLWSDHAAAEFGFLCFHDPRGIYASGWVVRDVSFNDSDRPQWVIMEMKAYRPPQRDLS